MAGILGSINQMRTFVVNSKKTLLYAIDNVINTGRGAIIRVGNSLKEHPFLAIGVVAASVVSGGSAYLITACSVGKAVTISSITGAVVGIFSYATLSNALEVHQKKIAAMQDEHQKIRKASVKAHQRKMTASRKAHQRKITALQKAHQRKITALQNAHQRKMTASQNAHQRKMTASQVAHQKEMAVLQETHQKDMKTLQGELNEVKRRHEIEKNVWETRFSNMEAIIQQLQPNQQQNGNAQ